MDLDKMTSKQLSEISLASILIIKDINTSPQERTQEYTKLEKCMRKLFNSLWSKYKSKLRCSQDDFKQTLWLEVHLALDKYKPEIGTPFHSYFLNVYNVIPRIKGKVYIGKRKDVLDAEPLTNYLNEADFNGPDPVDYTDFAQKSLYPSLLKKAMLKNTSITKEDINTFQKAGVFRGEVSFEGLNQKEKVMLGKKVRSLILKCRALGILDELSHTNP